jgi:hypothetical protein
MGGLFRLRNVTIVGYFYCLILFKLLHKSVFSRVILANIFQPENGHLRASDIIKWDPRRLIAVWAFVEYYRDRLALLLLFDEDSGYKNI